MFSSAGTPPPHLAGLTQPLPGMLLRLDPQLGIGKGLLARTIGGLSSGG